MLSLRLDRSPAFLAALALTTLAPTVFGQMVWKKATPQTSPPQRTTHAMAYDSARQRTVLFGGAPQGPPLRPQWADTWELSH